MDPSWYTKYSGDGFIANPDAPENEQNDGSKTGYTPLGFQFPTLIPTSTETEEQRDRVKRFQRQRLWGFTSRELANMDCLTTRELRPSSLTPVILPLFQRHRWETQPHDLDWPKRSLYPIDGYPGNWVAGNDEVWKVLKPILELASRMLISADLLHWFDVLLHGERRNIPIDRIASPDRGWKDRLQSFHLTNATAFKQSTTARDEVLRALVEDYDLRFCFFKPGQDPTEGNCNNSTVSSADAFTVANGEYRRKHPTEAARIYVFLKNSPLQSLLDSKLNSSERQSIEWYVAQVLVHECMHACNKALQYCGTIWYGELYFEKEPVREMGWSYEMATIGGVVIPMRRNGLPLAYSHHTPWTSKHTKGIHGHGPTLIYPPLDEEVTVYPIPMTLIDEAQQEKYWDVGVRKFGHNLLRYQMLSAGTRTHGDGVTKTRVLKHAFPSDQRDVSSGLSDLIRAGVCRTPAQRQILSFCTKLKWSTEDEQGLTSNLNKLATAIRVMQCIIKLCETNPIAWQEVQTHLKEDVANHQTIVKLLGTVELYRKTKDRAKRRDLLVWNRGARLCLRCLPPSQINQKMFQDLLKARDDLWDIDKNENGNWNDTQKLDEAHTLYEEGKKNSNETSLNSCVMLCEQIWNRNPPCSLLVRSAVEMMIMKLDLKWIVPDRITVKNKVEAIRKELNEIQPMDPQYQYRAKWLNFALNMISEVG